MQEANSEEETVWRYLTPPLPTPFVCVFGKGFHLTAKDD